MYAEFRRVRGAQDLTDGVDNLNFASGSVKMLNDQKKIFLSDLRPGDCAKVVGLTSNGTIKQRLLEMGFTRGAVVRVEKYAPMGDPIEFVIKGYHLSLRKNECQCILVVKEP